VKERGEKIDKIGGGIKDSEKIGWKKRMGGGGVKLVCAKDAVLFVIPLLKKVLK
jgi:hypothetical protein